MTLFGYHIFGVGFVVSQYIQKYSCPSSSILGVAASCYQSNMCQFNGCVGWHPIVQGSTKDSQTHSKHVEENRNRSANLFIQDLMYTAIIALPVKDKLGSDSDSDFNGLYSLYCYRFRDQNN